jgi:hypothetical protein
MMPMGCSLMNPPYHSALIAELELYGYVEVERKGRGRGRGVDFYIYPTDLVERKALLDAVKDLVG